jgi:large subunit ribosomal protein L9
MQVILKKDIEKLGKAGEVASVKDGYARNYLIPKGLALVATPGNLKVIEREKKKETVLLEQAKQQAQEIAEKINATSCTISVKAGEDGKLFGSVTNQDIALAYKQEGINIDRKKIELTEPIKEVGVFKVNVKLHPEVIAEAKIWVVKE